MTARDAFLAAAGWSGAEGLPIDADASDRSYLRLRRGDGATAILMAAPVATSDVARRQFDAFRDIGAWLRAQGLAAPAEMAVDPEAGLMLLQDLGQLPLSRLLDIADPAARDAYGAAVGVLAHVAQATPPEGLERPDPVGMAEMTRLTFEALPGADTLWPELRAALIAQLSAISGTSVLSLRDVHGDNLMWRPGEAGLARIGLLDFQDALLLPDGYDLASLLDDPRREVPETWRRDLVAAYAAARGVNVEEMAFRTDLLSLQRNLRVLGIFRRLAVERGRPSYARFIPRTRTLLARAAGHPRLAALGPLVLDLLAHTAQWPEAAA